MCLKVLNFILLSYIFITYNLYKNFNYISYYDKQYIQFKY